MQENYLRKQKGAMAFQEGKRKTTSKVPWEHWGQDGGANPYKMYVCTG